MVTKYFRFNMSDDNEDTNWGYATGSGEYSSENVSLDKIPYDEATGIIRSWLKNCGAITNTLEIDDAVARAFSKGSTSAVFRYDNGEKYRMTIETADNPVTEWEDFKQLRSEGLIDYNKNTAQYELTNKGINFLNSSNNLKESIQGTVGDFCKLKGIDTDQFVEFLQTNFDWARHCEAWTIVDFDCLERCFSKLDEATVAQAKRFATRKHGETGAVRKATGQPYIVHPEGVAALVKENGGDDEQIQAAWLHDTIEDTGATYDDIAEKFGKRVADIVSEVTNKPHLKKSEKEAYMTNKLKNLSHDALLVKLCDMRYNYYDYAPIEQRMRIEKNIKELMSSRELTKEEWQLCEEILDWDNTVEGLDENVISKTLRLSSLNA